MLVVWLTSSQTHCQDRANCGPVSGVFGSNSQRWSNLVGVGTSLRVSRVKGRNRRERAPAETPPLYKSEQQGSHGAGTVRMLREHFASTVLEHCAALGPGEFSARTAEVLRQYDAARGGGGGCAQPTGVKFKNNGMEGYAAGRPHKRAHNTWAAATPWDHELQRPRALWQPHGLRAGLVGPGGLVSRGDKGLHRPHGLQ